ncbi:hypothetical protein RRSWK_00001 [Rhodopirellula sp. SWK7]|nr:hypothetical protein RRSWK_00001 [Rhodopirellula sp. SWK7]
MKRAAAKGQAFLNAQQSKDMDAFIKLLADQGIDIDEVQADLDRWAKLTRQRPGSYGWFRKSEIARMERREAERKQNIEMP